jgi:hypothetical protein
LSKRSEMDSGTSRISRGTDREVSGANVICFSRPPYPAACSISLGRPIRKFFGVIKSDLAVLLVENNVEAGLAGKAVDFHADRLGRAAEAHFSLTLRGDQFHLFDVVFVAIGLEVLLNFHDGFAKGSVSEVMVSHHYFVDQLIDLPADERGWFTLFGA